MAAGSTPPPQGRCHCPPSSASPSAILPAPGRMAGLVPRITRPGANGAAYDGASSAFIGQNASCVRSSRTGDAWHCRMRSSATAPAMAVLSGRQPPHT